MGSSILETGPDQTTRVAVNRDEITARVAQLERIVAALKAMLRGLTFLEIDRAEKDLREVLTRAKRGV